MILSHNGFVWENFFMEDANNAAVLTRTGLKQKHQNTFTAFAYNEFKLRRHIAF